MENQKDCEQSSVNKGHFFLLHFAYIFWEGKKSCAFFLPGLLKMRKMKFEKGKLKTCAQKGRNVLNPFFLLQYQNIFVNGNFFFIYSKKILLILMVFENCNYFFCISKTMDIKYIYFAFNS